MITDRRVYPPRDPAQCPDVASAYPTCVSDAQVHSELQRLIAADGLPTAGSMATAQRTGELRGTVPLYFVVLPADVNVCQLGGTVCADNKMCAYHYVSSDAGNAVLYAVIPTQAHLTLRGFGWPKACQIDNHTAVQKPNGSTADLLTGLLSHEDSEMITDPLFSGWVVYGATVIESVLNEVGDKCAFYGPFDPVNGSNPHAFAPTLGGSAAAGTLYDQLINGHRYYTTSEWSTGNGNGEMRQSAGRIIPRFTVPKAPSTVGALLGFNPAASTSRNPYSSATWHFGDGSPPAFFSGTATFTRPQHRYRSPGRYTVTLTLVDNRGNLKSTTGRVSVHARRK